VACDDARIADALAGTPARIAMTSAHHASGTDRLAECARIAGWADDVAVVNLQGDEPFAPAAGIRAVAALLDGGAPMSTLATPITDAATDTASTDTDSADTFKVSGRGELHLSILIENMRREGYELAVSKPEVIFREIDGVKNEPMEYLVVDLPTEHQGVIIEKMGPRKGEMVAMHPMGDAVRLEFIVPARGLIGLRGELLTETRGTAVMTHTFHGYSPERGEIPGRTRGVLISMELGTTTAYTLNALEPRGVLFIGAGVDVYGGMIIGEHAKDNDLDVNPCKGKKMTNIRASGTDDAIRLTPPRTLTLEQAMEFIDDDELVEVTPSSIRLRKRYLDPNERKRNAKH
jgi:GTP-binding protein